MTTRPLLLSDEEIDSHMSAYDSELDWRWGAEHARSIYEADRAKLLAEIDRLREALTEIRDCMGGDNCDGWDNPNAVWGIATDALMAPPIPLPEPKGGE